MLQGLLNVLRTGVCQVIMDGQMHWLFYLIANIWLAVQTASCLTDLDSDISWLIRWLDPANYLPPAFSILLGFILELAVLVVFIVKVAISENKEAVVRQSVTHGYLGVIFVYLLTACHAFTLIPLLRASIMESDDPSTPGMESLGSVAAVLAVAGILPLVVVRHCNTFVLTPQLVQKLNALNIYLILILFQVLWAVASVSSEPLLLTLAAVFVPVFVFFAFKQPLTFYRHHSVMRAVVSVVAFAALARICEAASRGLTPGLVWIAGAGGSIALVEWVSAWRIRGMLELQQPTVHQIKLLIFFLCNPQQYAEKLQYFILLHYRRCSRVECLCGRVVEHLGRRETDILEEKVWYQFLISYIESHYNLGQMRELGETEMKLGFNKYQRLVVNVAEIQLFKLGRAITAYYQVDTFHELITDKRLAYRWFELKRMIINYYVQEDITQRYKTEGAVNTHAARFVEFQLQVEKYRKMLLRSAHKTANMWNELGKREPDADKLMKMIVSLERGHRRIVETYQDITRAFRHSDEVINRITSDYYRMVLNIAPKSSLHIIAPPKLDSHSKKLIEKERISENLKAFSLESETPVCFISVETENCGAVVDKNCFFAELAHQKFDNVKTINDMLMPEMHQWHCRQMDRFVTEDRLYIEHSESFMFDASKKIVPARFLIQLMPSITEGVRYCFFLMKQAPERKIACVSGESKLAYSSEGFDKAYRGQFCDQDISGILSTVTVAEVRTNMELGEKEKTSDGVKLLREFDHNDCHYSILEFTETNTLPFTHSAVESYKQPEQFDDIQEEEIVAQTFEKTGTNYREAQLLKDKQRKEEDRVREAYSTAASEGSQQQVRCLCILAIVIFLILLVLDILCIVQMQKMSQTYILASSANNKDHKFIMQVTRAALRLKLANTHENTNQAQQAANEQSLLSALTNVNALMDSMLAFYQVGSITQLWTTFDCNTQSTSLHVSSQKNFLTISDYIQDPLTNLATAPSSALNFDMVLSNSTLPLTAHQCQFWQLETNAIYSTIPRFRSLKSGPMNAHILETIDIVMPSVILFVLMLLAHCVYALGKFIVIKRVTDLKNYSYHLFESMSPQIIEQKAKDASEFVLSNTKFDFDQKFADTLGATAMSKINDPSRSRTIFSMAKPIKSQESGFISEDTERDLELGISTGREEKFKPKKAKKMQEVPTSTEVFPRSSKCWVAFKASIAVIPFIVMIAVMLGLEAVERSEVETNLAFQKELHLLQQDIDALNLYGLQYATYSGELSSHLSIPDYMTEVTNQMAGIGRMILSKSYGMENLDDLDALLEKIAHSDLCQLQQQGLFAGNTSWTVHSPTDCQNIAAGILTKGFNSAILNYQEDITTVRTSDPNAVNYTRQQRVDMLNTTFFTDTSKIRDYLDSILDTLQGSFDSSYSDLIRKYEKVVTLCLIMMLILFMLMLLTVDQVHLGHFKEQFHEISSLFILMSHETITKNDKMKGIFTERLDDYQSLK